MKRSQGWSTTIKSSTLIKAPLAVHLGRTLPLTPACLLLFVNFSPAHKRHARVATSLADSALTCAADAAKHAKGMGLSKLKCTSLLIFTCLVKYVKACATTVKH